jgi:DNA-binding GntR family transcriptional regulator
MAEQIDHEAGEPVWSQLAGIIRRQIQGGKVKPGKLLPSVRTLAQDYGLSDGTVKKALGQLRQEGLVEPAAGRGWYVTG